MQSQKPQPDPLGLFYFCCVDQDFSYISRIFLIFGLFFRIFITRTCDVCIKASSNFYAATISNAPQLSRPRVHACMWWHQYQEADMSIRKTIALWLWPGLEQPEIDAIRSEAFAQGRDSGIGEYAMAGARLRVESEHEKVPPYVPSESSARDVAGYSAQSAAQDIRKALQRLSDETGGMSAAVEVDWQEYQFIESDKPRAFLDCVTVKTGSVRATA